MKLKIKRVRDNADLPLPSYQSEGASGLDLRADIREPLSLAPMKRALIPTGLSVEIPLGYEAQIRPRSGLALKQGLSFVNTPGTIDADYRGEIGVIVINLGEAPIEFKRGDRIAQMVIAPVVQVSIQEEVDLTQTNRSTGGFGSTGI